MDAIALPPPQPRPPLVDDAAIIARSIDDASCFGELFERHGNVIHRYAASRVGLQLASDVVGDTFVLALRLRASFDPAGGRSALPWILGIATNVVRKHRAAERRWLAGTETAGSAGYGSERAHEDDSDAHLDAQRLSPWLRHALSRLKRGDRDAFVLHVAAGLSVHQVATALGVPSGTVKSRLHRARTLLATYLEDHA